MNPSTGKMAARDRKNRPFRGREAALFCERVVFPLLLFFWPFAGVRQGVDLTDTTYALTNSLYIDGLDPMWLLATWLPNVIGAGISRLPGGGTMLGMKLWCTLFVCVTAETSYYALGRLPAAGRGGAERFPAWMRFVGLWIAESLCWCPVVILYNYLTYLFMTLAVIFLLFAFEEAGKTSAAERSARRYLFLAGACLGLNLFVRFPNAVEVFLILAVWFHAALTERFGDAPGEKRSGVRREIVRAIWKRTGVCVGGYIAGVIIPIVIIMLRYGSAAYIQMIDGLFSMTAGAADYTPGGMVLSILRAYGTTLAELIPAVPVMLAGAAGFHVAGNRKSVRRVAAVAFVFLLALLFRVYYARGVFTRNYYYYDSMFEPAMMVIILTIFFCILAVFGLLGDEPFLRSAAMLVLLVILITPLGSNNYTFPAVNNLFLVLPLFLALLRAACGRLADAARGKGSAARMAEAFRLPFLAWAAVLTILLAAQGSGFHVGFAFGDGTDGTKRETMSTIPRARGMITTAANARALEELYRTLRTEHKEAYSGAERTAIIFGGAPGLHYLLELAPAMFTAWPDLDSNGTARIEAALSELAHAGEKPLVILRGDARRDASPWDFGAPEKAELILDYLSETDYNKLFRVEDGMGVFYEVYGCE